MGLTKSHGNMYPWVSHMHTHLRGECSHKCKYCYVQHGTAARTGHYSGPLRLDENQLAVNYGSGKTIFVEHCQDLFAENVPEDFIIKVLRHCICYPMNKYIFQTKNPGRMQFLMRDYWPKDICAILGATIETNRLSSVSNAPTPTNRALGMGNITTLLRNFKTFITIEPILDFDVNHLMDLILWANPDFVNIGADSKGTGLEEPSADKIKQLIKSLHLNNIEIREKHNLKRIIGNAQFVNGKWTE